MARPRAPSSSTASTSRVGFPRESRTSRARSAATRGTRTPSDGPRSRVCYFSLNNRQSLIKGLRLFEEDLFGHRPDPILRGLILDIFDGRLSVDPRQHQRAEMSQSHAFEVPGRPNPPHQCSPERARGIQAMPGQARLVEGLQEKVVQQETRIERRITPMDDLKIDQENVSVAHQHILWAVVAVDERSPKVQ